MKPVDPAHVWKSKGALRAKLAVRPILEKLRMLDAMRERALSLRQGNPRSPTSVQEQPPEYGTK